MDLGKLAGTAFKTVAGLVTGGLSDRVLEIVEGVTGGSVPPEKRAELKMALDAEITKRQQIANDAANDAERNITERAKELEGTATDLLQAGMLGRAVIFIRGAIRPTVTIGLGYVDVMVFSNRWQLVPDSGVESAFWIVNVVVFGFWFGERALQNAAPMVAQIMGKKG